jgi:flagellar biosynthesis protein FliP
VTPTVLMSMGMMMLPPVVLSLPFKLIFFVLDAGVGESRAELRDLNEAVDA